MARKKKFDFTGVESYVRASEGEHIAVVKSIEEKESQNGSDMLVFKFEVTRGSSTGATVYENFPLVEKALWKLKSFLEVVGMKADGKMILDLDKLAGKTCIIAVKHEEYNGNTRAKIDGFKKFEAEPEDDDIEDDEEEEEEPKKKPKKEEPKKKPKKAPEPEPEDEDEDEDEEETPPPKKKPKKEEKKKPKKPEPDDDDDDDWDEE